MNKGECAEQRAWWTSRSEEWLNSTPYNFLGRKEADIRGSECKDKPV